MCNPRNPFWHGTIVWCIYSFPTTQRNIRMVSLSVLQTPPNCWWSIHINHFFSLFFGIPNPKWMHQIINFYEYNYHLQFLTDLSISLDFFNDVATWIPWHSSHLFRAGTVTLSKGSSSLAPGTLSSVICWLDINVLHAQQQTRDAQLIDLHLPRGSRVKRLYTDLPFWQPVFLKR